MSYKSITDVPTSVLLSELVRRSVTNVVPVSSSQAYRVQVTNLGGTYRTESIGLGSANIVIIKD